VEAEVVPPYWHLRSVQQISVRPSRQVVIYNHPPITLSPPTFYSPGTNPQTHKQNSIA
jgi:hypothetical protein